MDVIKGLYEVIEGRKNNPEEGSYTCYLFNQGLDKILKKCGEYRRSQYNNAAR